MTGAIDVCSMAAAERNSSVSALAERPLTDSGSSETRSPPENLPDDSDHATANVGNQNRKASPEIGWRLATNLRRLRKARGYTQERLGKLCGFSKTYISNVEQGTVNICLANLEALANGLDCFEGDLLRRHP
jgi:DNA-binding XRE family transcriptional regulator